MMISGEFGCGVIEANTFEEFLQHSSFSEP